MGSDKVCQTLVGERQRHCDPLAPNPSPTFGKVPEREQEPVVHPLVMGDRQRDGEVMCPPRPASKQLEAELRPRVHTHDQTVVQHRQPSRLKDHPAHFCMNVRALGVPTPRPHDVPGAEQLDARTSEDVHLPRHQPFDDQKATVMLVGLDRANRIPFAGREMPLPSQRLVAGALKFGLIEKIGEVRVGVNDADEVGYGSRAYPPLSYSAWRSMVWTLPAVLRCVARTSRVRTLTYPPKLTAWPTTRRAVPSPGRPSTPRTTGTCN